MLISPPGSGAFGWLLALAVIGATTTGCYDTTRIAPTQVPRLAAGTAPAFGAHAVMDIEGNLVAIREPFSVQLDPIPELPPAWDRWRDTAIPIESPVAAEIRGPILVLQGKRDAFATQIPLAYLQGVRVLRPAPGKTAGLAVGVTLGGLTVIAGVVFGVVISGLGHIH